MRFKTRLKTIANIDMVPMIDVVFQLVVFFMVSSTFIETPGIKILYPESETTETVMMTRLVVTISENNRIFLNKDQYAFPEFEKAVNAIDDLAMEAITAVVIEGDEKSSYATMVAVLDVLRKRGFKGVSLRMTPKKEN